MAKKVNLVKNAKPNYDKYFSTSSKKPIIAAVSAVAVLLGAVGIVALQMVNKNKLDTAKTEISKIAEDNKTISLEINPHDDTDMDGLTNSEEDSRGTDWADADSDGDGVLDGAEVTLKTDPLNPDSDGDGLIDSIELMAGTDPNSKLTDGIEDATREFTYTKSGDSAAVELKGYASIYGTIFERINLVGFSANSSIVSEVYEFYNDEAFKSAKITFDINSSLMKDTLSVYKFNPSEGSFTEIASTVDKEAGKVSADIDEFGTYLVADGSTIGEKSKTRIHFLIDNSGSMYSDELIPNSPENDVEFRRLDFAKDLIEKFDDDFSFAVSRFTKDYHYMQKFTSDKEQLISVLDSIKTVDEKFNGTYIQYSLEECMKSFDVTDSKTVNMIVLITDGDSTEETVPDVDYISKLAKERNVIILTVSIGNNIDKSVLSSIASRTNGKYYSASDADLLTEVYKQIAATLNYDKITIDSSASTDGKVGYMLYNTGFVPSENGFCFDDYRTYKSDSMSFGLATFARNWFTQSLELKKGAIDNVGGKSDGYDFTGTDFETYLKERKNLRDISFIAVTTSRFTDVEKYLDFKGSKDEILEIEAEIKSEAIKKGWCEKRYILDKPVNGWEEMRLLVLDVDDGYKKIQSAYGDDEAMFYKAISRLNLEFYDNNYAVNFSQGNAGFSLLTSDLAHGIPAVLTIDGNRAVNAISLVQNAENPSEYILKVYDPAKKDMVTDIVLKKTVGPIVALDGTIKKTQNYFHASIDGKSVSLSVFANM